MTRGTETDYIPRAGGGASAFTDLTDVPNSYVGQALKLARVKAAEDGLEFAAGGGGGASITVGTYIGDGTVNRAIPHGLGSTPKLVRIVVTDSGATHYEYLIISAEVIRLDNTTNWAVTALNATNFYVGNAGSFPQSANAAATHYWWFALV